MIWNSQYIIHSMPGGSHVVNCYGILLAPTTPSIHSANIYQVLSLHVRLWEHNSSKIKPTPLGKLDA